MHLTGAAGVVKGLLIIAITEYVKRDLKYHCQKLQQPSKPITAATGNTASHINGLILHLALHLQTNGNNNSTAKFGQPFKEILQRLCSKYWSLKIIIRDGISMTGESTFSDYLSPTL